MDYGTIRPDKSTILKWCVCYVALSLLVGFLFYGTHLAGCAGMAGLPLFLKHKIRLWQKQRRQELLVQFKELIRSYGNSLKAGYSVENGFREAYKDLAWQYDSGEMIMTECRQMIAKMENKHSLEELFMDLGKRSLSEDIRDFASVFSVARKSGGNLAAIISDTAMKISDKLMVTEEIELMFASKRFEQKIMNCIPVFMMCYIGLGTPGYFDPLYKNAAGIAVMSGCLLLYGAALLLSQKIMDIRV